MKIHCRSYNSSIFNSARCLWYTGLMFLLVFSFTFVNVEVALADLCGGNVSLGFSAPATPLETGEERDITITLTNNFGLLNDPDTKVDAELVKDITHTLACDDNGCLVELPGTLEFIPVNMNGCVSNAAGVLSCAEVVGDSNKVLIDVDELSGVFLPKGALTNVVTIRVKALQPVDNPNGTFFMSAETLPNGVQSADPLCDPVVTGFAGASAPQLYPPACKVKIDKQISCDAEDGTHNFLDVGFGTMDDDGHEIACYSWNAHDGVEAENVSVQYLLQNAGEAELTCTISESNSGFSDPSGTEYTVGVEGELGPVALDTQSCSDDLAAGEPDTAEANCTCLIGGETVEANEAYDKADFECQTPGATFSKVCKDDDDPLDGIDDSVQLDAENTGTAPLVDCSIVDEFDGQILNLDCGQGVDPADFDLNPADTVSCTSDLPDFEGSILNEAQLSCTIANSGGKRLVRDSSDTCTNERCPEVSIVKSVDAGLGFEQSAIGWTDEPVQYLYEINIDGAVATTTQCTLTDNILGPIGDPNSITGSIDILVPPTQYDELLCGQELQNGFTVEGVNIGTLQCECRSDATGLILAEIEVDDDAELECQTPDVNIEKQCSDCDQETGLNTVTISVVNNGTAELINCVVDDLSHDDCDSDIGTLASQGSSDDITCNVDTGGVNLINTATVTCNIDRGDGLPVLDPITQLPKEVTSSTQATCIANCGEGCAHRTPGFWCTHCNVVENLFGGDDDPSSCDEAVVLSGLTSCGVDLNTAVPGMDFSTTEDLGWGNADRQAANGGDGTSPQQMQLVRACTAAELNIETSRLAGGDCESETVTAPDGSSISVGDLFDNCCSADWCGGGRSKQELNGSPPGLDLGGGKCAELLDQFNNAPVDTLGCPELGFPFCPGLGANGYHALGSYCSEANGNGFINSLDDNPRDWGAAK